VFNPGGHLVAWHRKAHLYPPTLEPSVFRAGDHLTTFEDPALGVVGVVIGFDGDFPEVAGTLARRRARLVVAPASYEVEGAAAWDVLYPALALANGQWWVQSNQCGAHATTTLLGASRVVAPTGTVVAEATRAVPGYTHPPELLVQRIDLHLAYQRDGVGALLEEGRRPELYVDN
jgi:predicted amidohydrolase